ncbi:MAG: EAL domain-containing protein [Pseudomonadota bacterium]
MDQSNRRLALQACLLILLTSSFLMGVSSLLIDLFPHAPLPPQWRLSTVGAIAVLLVSLGMLALLRDRPQWRRLFGGLVVVLGGYSLGHHLFAPATDSNLAWLTGHARLSPLPAALVLIIGGCCLMPPASPHTWRCYRLVGWLLIGIGAITLAYPLASEMPATSVAGITSLGSVFCLLLGAGLWIVGRQRLYPALSLPRTAVRFGMLGVTASIVVWLASSWGQYSARVDAADKLVSNIANGMEQRVETKVRLIERLAARWQALSEQPSRVIRPLEQIETRTYINDEPSLQALAYLGPAARPRWRVGREPADLLWLMDQLTDPATLSWLRRQEERERRVNWRFPDPQRSSHGLLAVSLDAGRTTMLAALDVAKIIDLQRHLETGGFAISYASHGREWGILSAEDWHEGITPRVFASHEATLPGGPTFTITALDGALSLTSLPGVLPVVFGLLGLMFSYQLIISRALVAIRDEQTTALQRSEQRFRSLFTQHPDAVFAHTRDGIYEGLNPVTETMAGLSERELLGHHFRSVVCEPACSRQDVERTESAFQRAANGLPSSYAMRVSRDGRPPQDLEVTLVPSIVNGEVDGVFGIAKDITARVAAEERLHILERSLEASSNGAVIVDVRQDDKPVIYVNPAFTRITGYLAQEVIGHPPIFLSGDETDPKDIEQIRATVRQGTSLSTTLRAYRRDGTPFWNQLFLSPVRDVSQRITHFIGIMNDISERKEQEQQLAYQATHDVLTGLGNRALFSDHLAHDVELAARNGQTLAVLFIDLDEFKPINDTLGHKVGDQLLVSVADRLRRGLRISDTLARLGGDEFVLLLPDLSHPVEAEEVAARLLDDLNKPHRVNGHELHVSASIGIAMNRGGLDEPERLLQHADMAMYKAKQQGRNTYQLYTEDLDSKLSQRVTLRSELQDAIEHGHLNLHYQPLLDRDGHVDGMEALVRWHHPTKGFISPATFIPIAEETGQIIRLSRWVMRQACQDARRLVEQGLLRGRMAINLSPLQFHRPNFLGTLRNVLDETGLAPEHLELELTEGILMRDTDGAIDILHALSGMAVSTAIDDFGTGFSSLSYLRDLPIDKIKIDRSFVMDAAESDKNAAICQGVITLAQELDLRVVAEGIETAEQHDYLMSLGCDVFQGFLFARPMPLDSLSTWLTQRAAMSTNRG